MNRSVLAANSCCCSVTFVSCRHSQYVIITTVTGAVVLTASLMLSLAFYGTTVSGNASNKGRSYFIVVCLTYHWVHSISLWLPCVRFTSSRTAPVNWKTKHRLQSNTTQCLVRLLNRQWRSATSWNARQQKLPEVKAPRSKYSWEQQLQRMNVHKPICSGEQKF